MNRVKQPENKSRKDNSLTLPFSTQKEWNLLFDIGMFHINHMVTKSCLNKTETEEERKRIVAESLNLLKDPEGFIKFLKRLHIRIVDMDDTNIAVKLTLRILRHLSVNAKNKYSRWSENYLRKAGLALFIPKHSRNRSSHPKLYFWRALAPLELLIIVQSYEKTIKRFVNYDKTWRKNRREISKAFEKIFNKPMPQDLIDGERGNQLSTIALAFLHAEYDVPYEALKSLYYDISKDLNKKQS